jgi:hypothetical protein
MNQLRLALNIIIVVFFMLCRLQGFAEVTPPIKDLQVVGWVERVSLFPGNLKIKAKLDTGARNSSLNATQIEKFQRDGENWIRFELKNWKGRKENIEARVIRMAKIKQHGTEAATRPVVRLGICVGNVYKEVEVNLEDRNKFNYQMLIGRSYLKNSFAVDSSATYTVEPGCRSNADQ